MKPIRGLFRQRGYFFAAIPYVISAIAGAASSAYGSKASADTAKKSAREQMAFQASQSATSYQRGMEDMRRAGLNPMLAYEQGGASSSPGAGYSADYSGVSNSALQALRMSTELQQMRAMIDNTKSGTELNKQLTNKAVSEAKLVDTNSALNALEIPRATTRANLEKTAPGKALTTFERIMESLGALFGRNSARSNR